MEGNIDERYLGLKGTEHAKLEGMKVRHSVREPRFRKESGMKNSTRHDAFSTRFSDQKVTK